MSAYLQNGATNDFVAALCREVSCVFGWCWRFDEACYLLLWLLGLS